jgi:general stress protein 26
MFRFERNYPFLPFIPMSVENNPTRQDILNFLQNENVANIATVNENGKPDSSTIYYFVEKNFDILFLTKKETEKYKNIQNQNEVVLIVTNPQKKVVVKIRGSAIEMKNDPNIITDMTSSLAKKLNVKDNFDTVWPILKRNSGKIVLVKIKPQEIRMSIYSEEGLNEKTVQV